MIADSIISPDSSGSSTNNMAFSVLFYPSKKSITNINQDLAKVSFRDDGKRSNNATVATALQHCSAGTQQNAVLQHLSSKIYYTFVLTSVRSSENYIAAAVLERLESV
jgi:phosphoribosyl 1,2-cyclic phosphodiesterase